ncbi:MAG: PEP/pyruvate-binding domain-containing protein, partial [Kofleriaceae bacterium]
MTTYVLGLHEIDRSMVPLAGGKGANLGELARIEGIRVPDGFCVTTDAFDEVLRGQRGTDGLIDGSIDRLIDELSGIDATARAVLGETSARLRDAIERAPVPDGLIAQVTAALAALGEGTPV